MDLKRIFVEILNRVSKEKFSEEEIDLMVSDFVMIATLNFVTVAKMELELADDLLYLDQLIKGKKFAEAVKFLEVKIEKEKLDAVVAGSIVPLTEDYAKYVIYKK